jgi:hypothetical protein
VFFLTRIWPTGFRVPIKSPVRLLNVSNSKGFKTQQVAERQQSGRRNVMMVNRLVAVLRNRKSLPPKLSPPFSQLHQCALWFQQHLP